MGMKDAKAPDGRRWKVRRRWISRRLNLKRLSDALDIADAGGFASGFFDEVPVIGAALAAVAIAIFVFFGLAFVIELVIVLALLAAVIIARFVLRMPWVVEASTDDPPKETRFWHVVGWRRTNEVMAQIAQALESGTEFTSSHAVPVGLDRSPSSSTG